jgi:hypothetical protein
MGKSTRERPAAKASLAADAIDATPQRIAMRDTQIVPAQRDKGEIMGHARRLVPAIDTLLKAGKLTDTQHAALAFYRNQVDTSERSPTKDSLDQSRGSGEHGLSAAVVSALLAVARIERDMGSVRDIARAVAVDDISLSEWCIRKHGGRERYDGKGRFVAMVPVAEKACMARALMELRYAAGMIVR